MLSFVLRLWLLLVPVLALGEMEWIDTIHPGNWLDKLKFQTGYSDEPNEFVHYVNYSNAVLKNLVRSDSDSFLVRVDDRSVLTNRANGRDSVSVRSQQSYGPGVMILDIDHIPELGCGARPRALLIDKDNREIVPIDLYGWQNHMGMMTTSNCSGTNMLNCNSNKFQACFVRFGSRDEPAVDFFNDIDGVVITVQWREEEVNMWVSSRRDMPRITGKNTPDSSKTPIMGRTFDTKLLKEPWVSLNRTQSLCGEYRTPIFPRDMKIGLETTFCGDDLDDNFLDNPSCAAQFRTCREAVATGPAAFSKTFWKLRSITVYRERRPFQ